MTARQLQLPNGSPEDRIEQARLVADVGLLVARELRRGFIAATKQTNKQEKKKSEETGELLQDRELITMPMSKRAVCQPVELAISGHH